MLQQERLRALGQMASGIAHDINNAVSPIALYTDSLLEGEPDLSPRTRQCLEVTQRAIEDVAHTVGRMREFYRQGGPDMPFTEVDLNRLVPQVIDLTRARWSDMPQQRGIVIDVKTSLAPKLPALSGIESEIREALTNLVFNAVDAMPEGGTMTLRTITRRDNSSPGSEHVQIEVTDTGIGMDEIRNAAVSSRSSRPKASAARVWAWPWCMEYCAGTGPKSRSRAHPDRAPRCA